MAVLLILVDVEPLISILPEHIKVAVLIIILDFEKQGKTTYHVPLYHFALVAHKIIPLHV